jgi:hypothetical protein
MDPHIATYCAVASKIPGTAVFMGTAVARKDAKYSESRPLKKAKIPLINIMMPSKSTPGGFSVCTLLQDSTFVFNEYT